jgi:ABC-type sugar transport system permease subunit
MPLSTLEDLAVEKVRRARLRLAVVFLLPASAFYLIFFLVPAAQAFYYSLFDWRGVGTEKVFVGLRNFQRLLGAEVLPLDGEFPFLHLLPNDQVFWRSMRCSLLFMLLGAVITFALAFAFTFLLSSGVRGKKWFRAIIFFPNVVPTIALTTLWGYIYNPRFGLGRGFLDLLGLESLAKTPWMGPDYILYSVLVAMCWTWTGFYLVLLLAGVDRIPKDLLDATKVDGATQWQAFTRVTIPLMWDVVSLAIVLWGIGALKIFEFPYAISGMTPPQDIWTVPIYLYVMGFGKRDPVYQLGYACAIGVVLLITVIIFVLIVRRFLRREAVQY